MARIFGGSGRIRVTQADIDTDRAIATARRKASFPRGAAGLQARITQMADIMVERAAANDNCTEEDLRSAGFDSDEIAQLRDRAARRASLRAPHLCVA